MKRREFITLLGGAAAAWPAPARAEQAGKLYQIGFLGVTSHAEFKQQVDALRSGLRQAGYEEGKNIVIHYRWPEGRYDRLPELAADLVKLDIDVLVVLSTPGARAAKQATSTVPIVMAAVGDPVAAGLVASLARPGGNLTGLTFFFAEICAKRVELIREMIPALTRLAVIANPANPSHPIALDAMQGTARALGIELVPAEVKGRDDFAAAIAAIATRQIPALVAIEDPLVDFQRSTNCALRSATTTTDDWVQSTSGSRRTNGIRSEPTGSLFSLGRFHRQDFKGHSAGELAYRARREVRAHRQPEDRQGARPRNSADPARPRRRGDRMMRRREFITLLGGAAAGRSWRARSTAMPVIGFLNSSSPDTAGDRVRAYHNGLRETGYVEGRNVTIEYRWADGQNERLPSLAADLVKRDVSLIVTGGTPATLAAKAATTKIPIVFILSTDPVEAGLVGSLNRPGNNLTGVTGLNVELAPKKLELLRELVPTTTTIALLINPTNRVAAERESRDLEAAARSFGLQLHVLNASTEREFHSIFASLLPLRADALIIGSDLFFTSRSKQLAALTVRYAVPSIYQFREFVAAGGLLSYGGSIVDWGYQGGIHSGRILAGAKPADLPVQQATKVELFVNLKTAKALGLTFRRRCSPAPTR